MREYSDLDRGSRGHKFPNRKIGTKLILFFGIAPTIAMCYRNTRGWEIMMSKDGLLLLLYLQALLSDPTFGTAA